MNNLGDVNRVPEVRVVSDECFERMRNICSGWSAAKKVCVAATGVIIMVGTVLSIGLASSVAVGAISAKALITASVTPVSVTPPGTNVTESTITTSTTYSTQTSTLKTTTPQPTVGSVAKTVKFDKKTDMCEINGVVKKKQWKVDVAIRTDTNYDRYAITMDSRYCRVLYLPTIKGEYHASYRIEENGKWIQQGFMDIYNWKKLDAKGFKGTGCFLYTVKYNQQKQEDEFLLFKQGIDECQKQRYAKK